MVHHVYQAQSQTGRLINAKSPVNGTKPPCLSWFRPAVVQVKNYAQTVLQEQPEHALLFINQKSSGEVFTCEPPGKRYAKVVEDVEARQGNMERPFLRECHCLKAPACPRT